MAHRIACDLSDRVAAAVSLAGAVFKDASKCAAAASVSVLEVHGDADQVIQYQGGTVSPGIPFYPSAHETISTWASKNGCTGHLAPTGEMLDLDANIPGAETG